MFIMFQTCSELEYLDLSNFDTSNVTNMELMFQNCYKLKLIKGIQNFIINKQTKTDKMFKNCPNFENYNISISNFSKRSPKKFNEVQEEIIAVNFISTDQMINYPVACKNIDIFSMLENKLFLEYPELKNKDIYFVSNGNVIDKTVSLEKNQIKNGSHILIVFKLLIPLISFNL